MSVRMRVCVCITAKPSVFFLFNYTEGPSIFKGSTPFAIQSVQREAKESAVEAYSESLE